MLRVSLAASGTQVAVLDADKLDEMMPQGTGRSILALKKYLSQQVHCSRFRQRILNGSAVELCDDQEIFPLVDLQLVILDFWPSEKHEDAKLVFACEQNELEKVEVMLQRPQNPDARDRDGWPALHFAARVGNASCMELLLESRADLEIRSTEDGFTALHCAAFNGHAEVLKLLLDAGADRNTAQEEGATALHLATWEGHLEIVRLLLDAGADKDCARTNGRMPLHLAAVKGHLEVVRLLLDAGAEKDCATPDGFTPLHHAANKGHLEVARLLLDAGAEKDYAAPDGFTPLLHAAYKGHWEVAQLLIDAGADKNSITAGWLDVARVLLSAEVEIDSTAGIWQMGR